MGSDLHPANVSDVFGCSGLALYGVVTVPAVGETCVSTTYISNGRSYDVFLYDLNSIRIGHGYV